MVEFRNNGPLIERTNYWDTPHAQRGYAYLSLNAGAYRLLMPQSLHSVVADITSSEIREVVISRGAWPEVGRPDGIEVMFDDRTNDPISVHILTEQVDRLPLPSDQGWKGLFLLYHGPPEKLIWQTDRVYYRRVKRIPWLKPAPGSR